MVNERLLKSLINPELRKEGKRHDGRRRDQYRDFEVLIGVVERAQGSALVRLGKTHVLAVVHGPYEAPRHVALPDRAILNVVYRTVTYAVMKRKKPTISKRERELSRIIREALEGVVFLDRYPRSQIDVYVYVISSHGGSRTTGCTAAALALADAGIPMKDLVIGLAGGKVEGHVVVDLDDIEDKIGDADLPLMYLPNLKKLSMIQADGIFTRDELIAAVRAVVDRIEKGLYPTIRETIMRKYGSDSDVYDR